LATELATDRFAHRVRRFLGTGFFALFCAMLAGISAPASAQAPRISFITVDTGVAVEVIDWGGSGRPIILLAGNGQTAHSFDEFAPLLARHYHVYGITRRGFGASSKPTTGYRTDRRADDVLAVIDSLGLTLPVLAGHSMGGDELSSIGSRYPKRVAGLVFLDSYGAFYDGTHGDFITNSAELRYHLDEVREAGGRGKAAVVDSLLSMILQTDLPALQHGLVGMQQASRQLPPMVSYPLMPPPTTGVARSIDDGRQRYTAIRAPILAFFKVANPPAGVGTDSAATRRFLETSPDIVGRFARGLPNARVVVLPNADHFVFSSNPQEVLAEMRAFIDRLPDR
jgi:pimeloyl-ACP methyl ester carboxylesterase